MEMKKMCDDLNLELLVIKGSLLEFQIYLNPPNLTKLKEIKQEIENDLMKMEASYEFYYEKRVFDFNQELESNFHIDLNSFLEDFDLECTNAKRLPLTHPYDNARNICQFEMTIQDNQPGGGSSRKRLIIDFIYNIKNDNCKWIDVNDLLFMEHKVTNALTKYCVKINNQMK